MFDQRGCSLEIGKGRVKQLKQKLIIPLTENKMMARQMLIDLARKGEEEMEWTVELEDREACEDLMETGNEFEKAIRREKAAQMKYADVRKFVDGSSSNNLGSSCRGFSILTVYQS